MTPRRSGGGSGRYGTGMRIRSGEGSDLNDVVELWAAGGLAPSFVGFRNELQRKLLRDPDLFLVAETAEGVIGALTAGWDGRMPWVSRLAVHPLWRRRGVAQRLLEELWQRLERLGAPTDRILVLDDHDAGRQFWEAVGFVQDNRYPSYRRR